MLTSTTIKSIQDIMRQDVGVDGDAQRLAQLVWLIFLKILDDSDESLKIRNDKFIPTLPEKLRWSTWAAPMDGMTGDELIKFANDTLLPGLQTLPQNGNERTDLVRAAFNGVYNYMRKGTLLRQVVNKVSEIDFNKSEERHHFNEIYERLLRQLQAAKNYGELYTPRALTQFIVQMIDPQLGEQILDPAAGTGGFLVHTLEHLREQVKTPKDEKLVQKSIHGVEKKPLPFMLLLTNMMLHDVEAPTTMLRGNTLERPLRDYGDSDRVDCVVTNPPFGGTEEPGIESNFPKAFQTRETADLFLVLIVHLLKKGGRAGMVLPDSFLQGETGVKLSVKKELLENCNLHTIVKIPKNAFAPYTSIATNLLFFTKGEPTKEIWFYEHPYPEGRSSYTMTNPIGIEEFKPEKKWWNNRVENDHTWKVSIKEIVDRGYNLDIKNPNAPEDVIETPEALLGAYTKKRNDVNVILQEIKKILNEALKHHDN
jgi:type I restriction enzyme M protein